MEIQEYINTEIDTMIKKLEMYRIYERKKDSLNGILEELNQRKQDFSKPRAINFEEKNRTTKTNDITNDFVVNITSKEKYLETELNLTNAKMKEIMTIINLISNPEVKDYMIRHYVNGEAFEVLSSEKFCSRNKMFYNIRKELRKIITSDLNKR